MGKQKEEIERLKKQEETLVFDTFTSDDAYRIGTMLIEKAQSTGVAYTIDITLNHRQLFHFSMEGTSPDNDQWIIRKRNAVYHFFKSSHRLALELEDTGETLFPRYGLRDEDYVAAGGCFPITLRGTGVVGTIAVSGLPSEQDHAYVTEVIRAYLTTADTK